MKAILDFLKGKKTYLLAIAAAIYATGIQAGWWTQNAMLDILLLSGGAATLRSAINTAKDEGPNGGNQGKIDSGGVGAGNTKIPAIIFALFLPLCAPVWAQDATGGNPAPMGGTLTEAATTMPGNWFVEGFKAVSGYIAEYGEQRAGVGGTLDALSRGEFDTVLIQQISLPPLTTNLKGWELQHSLGAVHTTTFSGERMHEGIGLGISWRLIKIKPVAGVSLPTIGDLSELRLGLSISPDVDKAIDGKFGSRWTVCAITAGWGF